MRAQCTHCKADYDFPMMGSFDQPIKIKCEKCDQVFELAPAKEEALPLSDLPGPDAVLDGLDEALRDFKFDVPLEPVQEVFEIERGDGSRAAVGSAQTPAASAPSAAPTVGTTANAVDEEFHLDFDAKGKEPAGRPGIPLFMDEDESPAAGPARQSVPQTAPPAPAAPASAAAVANGTVAAGAAAAQPPAVEPEPRPPVRPRRPARRTGQQRSPNMPEDDSAKSDESLDELLNFDDGFGEGGDKGAAEAEEKAPPKVAPRPRKTGATKRAPARGGGFSMPTLSPTILIAAGGVLALAAIVAVVWIFFFGEGSAADQWEEAQATGEIDALTAARIFLRAAEEPDENVLRSVFYGKTAPSVESGEVESAGQESDRRDLGQLGAALKDKEAASAQKKGELAAEQAVIARYQSLQRTGDPDDIRIFIDSKRREIESLVRRMTYEKTEAGEDLKRVEFDLDQIKAKIAKAETIVARYSKPQTPLEKATYDTNVTNIGMYKQDLVTKQREYDTMKEGVDAKIAEIEALYLPQQEAMQKMVDEKTQDLMLLEALKSDNPKPLLDLQARVATLTADVDALDREIKALREDAVKARQSLSRDPAGAKLLDTGSLSASRIEVKGSVEMTDGSTASTIVLSRYTVEDSGKKIVGDWLVESLK